MNNQLKFKSMKEPAAHLNKGDAQRRKFDLISFKMRLRPMLLHKTCGFRLPVTVFASL